MELQEQLNAFNRELRSVRNALNSAQREARMNSVTSNQIQSVEPTVELYRSVGKAFILTPKSDVEARLEKETADLTKAQRDLTDREEYLTRRVASHTSNLRDLTGQ
jgi:prefoldin subunit 1